MNEGQVVKSEAQVAGWETSGAEAGLVPTQVGALSAVVREDTELKAAIVSAKRFPREEAASYARIMRACERPSMAEDAAYSFPRGGKPVTGPSVYLAREAARCWGNIRHGLRIVSVDEEQVHVRGYALDLETNAYAESEDRFAKKIQRKVNGRTQWVDPDERDLRELVNRRGAICVRNAILQVIPADIIEDALRKADDTLRRAAKGELEQNREDAVRRLVVAFDRFGVRPEMLATFLQHELSLITPDELAELRKVYTSIEDGNTRVADHFTVARAEPGGVDLNERIRERAQQPAPEPKAPPEPKASKAQQAKTDAASRDLFRTVLAKHRPDLIGDDVDTKYTRELFIKEQTGKEREDQLTREDHRKLIGVLQQMPKADARDTDLFDRDA